MLGLAGGLFFWRKFSTATDEREKTSAKNISFASLAVAILLIVYVASQLTGTPSASAKDRITPVINGKGDIISQPKDPIITKDAKKEVQTNNTGKPVVKNKAVNKNVPTNGPVGVITGTDVRMREFGNANSKILGYFDKGEKVSILESKNGWHRVQRSDNSVGWVSGDFCKPQ